jgi:NADPH:quinone reductase-like Zn-dependent oxidoreductase
LLTPRGTFASTDGGPGWQNLPLVLWSAITGSGRVRIPVPKPQSGRPFVELLKGLMETGRFHAVVDRRYPLDAIADAYRYVLTGQKVGIVVIDVMPAATSSLPSVPRARRR